MEKLPKSALSYYVQLYCKKRQLNQDENNQVNLLAEATRSWSNLTPSKKKIFLMKFNNCHLKLRKRFADKLKNAKPFPDPQNQVEDNSLLSTSLQDVCNDNSPVFIANRNSMNENSGSVNNVENYLAADTTQETQQNISNINNNQETCLEPIPPAFRTTKELYNIIKKTSEEVVPWEMLTRAQKAPYMTTGCRIKRHYLIEYTNYLESLSNENLLAYYKMKINDLDD